MSQSNICKEDLELMQKQIIALKNYISSLQKRLALINNNYVNKSNFEKNEIDIVIYETKYLINKKLLSLGTLENAFKTKLEDYNNEVTDVLNNYDSLLFTIMNFYQDDVEIKHILYPINWVKINNDFELKKELYFNLKNFIDKKPKGKV